MCPAIPTDQKAEHKADGIEKEHVDQELDDLGLEYGRYLQEVVAALEEDKEFAHKLENASIDSIKSGAIADQLHFVNHAVRSKLDELKRIEIDRLRQLTKKEKLLKDQIQRGQNSDRGSSSDSRSWRSIHDKITVAAGTRHDDYDFRECIKKWPACLTLPTVNLSMFRFPSLRLSFMTFE